MMNGKSAIVTMALCAALALAGAANAAGPDYGRGQSHPSYGGQRHPQGPPPGAHGSRRHGPPPPRCRVESVRGPKVMLHCDKTDRITPGSHVVVLKPRPRPDGRHMPPPRDGHVPPPRDAGPPAQTR